MQNGQLIHEVEVKCLEPKDIQDFLDLQNSDKLTENQKKYIKPRTAEDLATHMSAPMPIIGVYKNGALIAGALLTYPKYAEDARNLEGYPMDDTTAIMQGVVSIEKGGLGILVSTARELAAMNGYVSLLAKVHEENTEGQEAFSRRKFYTTEIKPDPIKGYTAHFMKAVIDFESSEPAQPVANPQVYLFLTEVPPEESQQVHIEL